MLLNTCSQQSCLTCASLNSGVQNERRGSSLPLSSWSCGARCNIRCGACASMLPPVSCTCMHALVLLGSPFSDVLASPPAAPAARGHWDQQCARIQPVWRMHGEISGGCGCCPGCSCACVLAAAVRACRPVILQGVGCPHLSAGHQWGELSTSR